ncbi:MAG: fibronectin type III domain-containing protein, partial [Bacteroidales bacterium]|nr:fibronectin type III domain-containing protein [Bacteroidales bacterium]
MQKHLQKLVLIVAMVVVPWATRAQSLADYVLTVDTTTFNSIASTGTQMTFSSNDDGYASTTLPFAFSYGENTFPAGTSIACSANGFLSLNASSASGTTATYSSASLLYITPLLQQDAHMGRNTGAGAYYLYNADSGTYTIEYHLLGTYSSPYGAYSYQIVFHTDNTIEIIYDSVNLGTTSSRTFATYLTDGPHNDYLFLTGPWSNPTMSSTYSTRSYTTLPAHGLRYTLVRPVLTCPRLTNLTANATASSAYLRWNYSTALGIDPIEYEVAYGYTSDAGAALNTVLATDLNYTLTGLNPDTSYTVTVRPVCGVDDSGMSMTVVFSTMPLPCLEWDTIGGGPVETYVVGTPGSSSTNVMPTNGGYNYAYCNHLIRTSDINATGPATISGIDFQFSGSSPMTNKTNCTLYMCHTSLTSCTDFANPADLVLVYEGPLNCSPSPDGWNHFAFNRNFFDWNGTSNMMVAIVDNSGATDANATFYYENIGSAISHRVYRNDSPYTFADLGTVTASNSVWRTNMRLTTGGGNCLTIAQCAQPYVIVDSLTSNELYLSWLPGYEETMWDVDYRAEGDTLWTNAVMATTSTNLYLSGLTQNTQYEIRVTALCSDSNMAQSIMVRTMCQAETLPFVEGFESWPTSSSAATPSCWYRSSTYSSGYPYVSTSYGHNGSRSAMYMYSGSGSYSYFSLPVMSASVDSLQISFWLYSTYSGYNHTIEVGVMDDPSDMSTFTLVGSVHPVSTYEWEPFEVMLNTYTGNGKYITLKTEAGSTTYPYLDDIEVTRISSCPRVRNVSSHGETLTDATITWDTTSATEYEVEYGPHGFTHGSGTLVQYIYDDSVTITGLSATSQYDVYVRGVCDPDTSVWSFCYSFYSACGTIDTLPFGNDFNSLTENDHAPHCWNGTSSYDSYYPASDAYEDRFGSGKSLYMYMYEPSSSDYTILQLPVVDTNELPIRTLQLNFSIMSSYGTGGMVVGVCTAPGMVGFTPIDTVIVNEDYTWHDFEVPLTAYSDTGMYITLSHYCPPSGDNDLYLDEVHLVAAPLCVRPRTIRATTVTTTDALLRWAPSDSSQTDFEVRYGNAGCSVDTLTSNFVSGADSLLLTGLDSGMVYSVFVRAICGVGDTSFWTEGSFRTLASSPISNFPYICDFTGPEGRAWNLENGTETNRWYLGSAAFNGTADSMAIYISSDNGLSNVYDNSSTSFSYAYRSFDMPAGQYAYSFDWRAQGESQYYDFIRVFLAPASDEIIAGQSPNGGTSSYSFGSELPAPGWIDLSLVTTAPYTLNQHTSWTNLNSTFTLSTGGTYNLVFAWSNDGSGGSNPPAAIDNVQIYRNTCPSPDNFRVTGNTASSITVTWDSTTTSSSYELSIDTTTGNPTADTTVTAGPVTFNGLTAGTTYYIYIRAVCDYGTDSSMWVGPISAIPGTWDMRANQNDTLYMCGGVIYDDGGASGAYTNSQTSTIIIYPDSPNNLVQIQGTFSGEGC